MSIKKDFYLVLSDLFKDKFKEVKTFRLFNNQLENEEREKVFNFPAMFLEFEQIDWIQGTSGENIADIQTTFHICLKSLADEDLRIFDLEEKLNQLLIDSRLGFSRLREEQDTDHDNVNVWKSTYQVKFKDEGANIPERRRKKMVSALVITSELVIDEDSKSNVRSDDKI